MVLQAKDYIQQKKRYYLRNTCIWAVLIILVFTSGLIIYRSRESYFTVFAGVLVVGAALNLTRWIGFGKFKDGNPEYAAVLEEMKGSYSLFHSAIMPDTRGTLYFEHVVVTANSIYLISYDEQCVKRNRLWLENKFQNKGIEMGKVHIVCVRQLVDVKNLAHKIEKAACQTGGHQEEYTKIINEMLM